MVFTGIGVPFAAVAAFFGWRYSKGMQKGRYPVSMTLQIVPVLQSQHERVPAETAGSRLVDLSALPPTDTVSPGAPNDNAAPASPGDSYPPPVLLCPSRPVLSMPSTTLPQKPE